MKVDFEQARAALESAAATRHRSAQLRSYALASPYLLLWGAIWVLAFGLCQWQPERSGLIWMVFDVIGVALGLVIVLRRPGRRKSNVVGVRYVGICASLCLFFWAAFFILRPVHSEQIAAFISLTVAMIYVVGGLVLGKWRIVVTGAILAFIMLFGYVFFQNHFFSWMSIVGGGVLLGAGFWLKRV